MIHTNFIKDKHGNKNIVGKREKMKKTIFTLHEDFELAHDFLYEAIKKKYTLKKLLKMIKDFLYELNSNEVKEISEEDITEWIEDCIWEANDMYNRNMITKEQRDKYIAIDSDREKIRKQLEQDEKPLVELIAVAEFISALLGKPTQSFLFFLELHKFDKKIEENFVKMQEEYNSNELKVLIPVILKSVIKEIKKDAIIEQLGINDEKDKLSWKSSIEELEKNLRLFHLS